MVETTAAREKRRVALTSVIAAVVLTGTKLTVGVATNSLGILAEALHSGLDLVAAAVTFWAVRASAKPADGDHPYGHGKVENLSALFQTVLLLVTCVWIIYEALHRLLGEEAVTVAASAWAFAVVILSIIVDYGRSRALMRVAKKYQSQALEADALHFSTDIWSSGVVLLGLLGVLLAPRLGLPWLAQADAVAALGVAVIVIAVCWKLGRKSVNDLLDAVPPALRTRVAQLAATVPGVAAVTQVRARRSGPEIFADITLTVDRGMPFERAHAVADAAAAAVRAGLPQTDVTVHIEPQAAPEGDTLTVARAVAARHGHATHGLRLRDGVQGSDLELHLEVEPGTSVADAHRQADALEAALHVALPALGCIDVHLEPAGEAVRAQAGPQAQQQQVQQALDAFCARERRLCCVHDVRLQQATDGLSLTLHCTVAGETPISDAHALTAHLEEHLRRALPALRHVLIHLEPRGESGGAG